MKIAGSVDGAPHFSSLGKWLERWRRAREDLVEGVHRYELWGAMGLQSLKRRYRRSLLGPLWVTLSLAILVTTLSLLYGRLMDIPLERYVPHVALGFIAWAFIQGVVNDACNVFIDNRGWIINVRMPLSLFVFRMVWEHLITMGHNALVYVGVALVFGIFPGAAGLLIVPVLIFLVVNAIWVGLLLGVLCARFRDIPPIVQSLMRVGFFLTPIIWGIDQLGPHWYLALFNPFTYFVNLLREPLIGQVPSALTWGLALAVTLGGWTVTGLMFMRFRARIAYWV